MEYFTKGYDYDSFVFDGRFLVCENNAFKSYDMNKIIQEFFEIYLQKTKFVKKQNSIIMFVDMKYGNI